MELDMEKVKQLTAGEALIIIIEQNEIIIKQNEMIIEKQKEKIKIELIEK